MSYCPWSAKLPAVATDALGDTTYAAIEHHVENCPDCKENLERLAHEWADHPLDLPRRERSPSIPGFQIGRELGRGAMGVVYLATQIELGRPVALKVLSRSVGPDARSTAERRWLREARAVSRIRHPGVVSLYDYGQADGWMFLVLEYVPGGNLKARLTEPLHPRAAIALLERIARAVAYIHGQGLLHLDLKPSNILLDGEDGGSRGLIIPRVADFGLALFNGPDHDVTASTQPGPRGTPCYMAPEQTTGSISKHGPATDIYAMGAILFELLTGRPPFTGPSAIETMEQVRTQPVVDPRRLNPSIPRDVETICLKCLEKEPSRRYASAEALAEDLARWRDGRPIQARPVSASEKLWRWCLRRPIVAVLIASLVITLSGGFLNTLFLWRYAESQRARAEAERTQAAADYKIAHAALAEILDLSEKSLEPTVVVTRDQFIVSLQAARQRVLELDKRRPNDPAVWDLLADVDLFLGRNLEFEGRLDEGESLYVESLARRDRFIQQAPGEPSAMYRRWQTLECLARLVERAGRASESLQCWERATAFGESFLPRMVHPDFNTMDVCRESLARLLQQQGLHDRAGRVLIARLAMLENLPAAAMTPYLAGRLVETRAEILRARLELDEATAETWAGRAVDLLQASVQGHAPGAISLSEAGFALQQAMSNRASGDRRAGKREEARRNVARMHALGRRLVSTCPKSSAAHLALSLAYGQSAKEAFQTDDLTAVQRYWKLGLDEARQALRSDFQDARARDRLAAFEERLKGLLVSR